MSGLKQAELFPRVPPTNIMEMLEAKLPLRDWVLVSDVALAGNISTALVYAWIEEGLIEAVNVGTNGKSYYKIMRASVITFYRKRLGVES